MADYIRRDIESRVRGGAPPADALSLPAIARHYGVSYTPAREALRILVEEGVLLRKDNRRVEINPAILGKGPLAPPPPPEPDDERIARELLLESLAGEPAVLREDAMSRRFGLGRMLLRQTFARLAGMGIIDHLPRRGWRIRPFLESDLAAYLEVREELEAMAFRLARDKLEPEVLQRMLAGNSEPPAGQQPTIDNGLHAYIVEKAGNRFIADFFKQHGGYFRWLFDHATPVSKFVAESAAQHRDILESALRKDWPAAEAALRFHIRSQGPLVRRMVAELKKGKPAAIE